MIQIEKDNFVNWEKIKAEYIGGSISQRQIAKKYGINKNILMTKAHKEQWAKDREEVRNKAHAQIKQKASEAIADTAVIASRIKMKLLLRLEKEIDALPEYIGSELINTAVEYGKNDKGNKTRKESAKGHKLRDLTSAYKDLTEDMMLADAQTNELLSSLMELERRVDHG